MAGQQSFASLLKLHRHTAGLTQEELAGRAGLGARTVSDLERGVSRAPYPSTVRRLVEALGLSAEDRAALQASARLPADRAATEAGRGMPAAEGGFLGASPVAPLVGRGEQLRRVAGEMKAVESSSGRLLLLSGQAGVGKTRLAQEVSLRARQEGFLVATGRCYEAQSGVPFYPFLEALSTLYEAAPGDVREAVPARWPYLTRLLPDHFPRQAELASSGSQEELQLLLRAVTGFLRAAARSPIALFLDDLHWVDGASLELLRHVARHTRGDRILVLGTYRDAEVGRQHPLHKAVRELGREQLAEDIAVAPLTWEETAGLISERLQWEDVSEEFASAVYGHTGGNPFFISEVLRTLIERGDLLWREGRWVRKEIESLEVPEGVREMIAEGLSRLTQTTQELLYEAAVLGAEVDAEDLRAVSGRREEDVEGALEEAASTGLVQPSRDGYAFNHALTHQALYAELAPSRRKRLHRAAGEGLETLGERVWQRRSAELARHFVEGDAPVRALPYALLAGDGATAVFAHEQAESHYRAALALARELDDRSGETQALKRVGDALMIAARYGEALVPLEKAAELAVQSGDRDTEAQAVAQIGLAHYYMGGAGEELIERLSALAEARDTPSPPSVSPQSIASVLRTLAALLFGARRYDESLEAAGRMSSLGRDVGDTHTIARAEMARAIALMFLHRPEEALQTLEAALPLAEEAGATLIVAFGMLMLDLICSARGDLDRGLEWAERGLDLAHQLDNHHEIVVRSSRIGFVLFHKGEWEKARAHLEHGTEVARSIGPLFHSAWAPGFLGMLCMAQGARQDAARYLEEAAGLSEQMQWSVPHRYVLSLRARLDLLQGRPEDARARLQPVADAAGLDWIYATVLLTVLASAYLELGDLERADSISDRALREAESMHNRLEGLEALRIRGKVLSGRGRPGEAAAALDEALSRARAMPHPYAQGKILREHGMLHAVEGDHDEARERLREALATLDGLGARDDAERTRRALRELR